MPCHEDILISCAELPRDFCRVCKVYNKRCRGTSVRFDRSHGILDPIVTGWQTILRHWRSNQAYYHSTWDSKGRLSRFRTALSSTIWVACQLVLIYPQIRVDKSSPDNGSLVVDLPEDSGCESFSVPLRPSQETLSTWTMWGGFLVKLTLLLHNLFWYVGWRTSSYSLVMIPWTVTSADLPSLVHRHHLKFYPSMLESPYISLTKVLYPVQSTRRTIFLIWKRMLFFRICIRCYSYPRRAWN